MYRGFFLVAGLVLIFGCIEPVPDSIIIINDTNTMIDINILADINTGAENQTVLWSNYGIPAGSSTWKFIEGLALQSLQVGTQICWDRGGGNSYCMISDGVNFAENMTDLNKLVFIGLNSAMHIDSNINPMDDSLQNLGTPRQRWEQAWINNINGAPYTPGGGGISEADANALYVKQNPVQDQNINGVTRVLYIEGTIDINNFTSTGPIAFKPHGNPFNFHTQIAIENFRPTIRPISTTSLAVVSNNPRITSLLVGVDSDTAFTQLYIDTNHDGQGSDLGQWGGTGKLRIQPSNDASHLIEFTTINDVPSMRAITLTSPAPDLNLSADSGKITFNNNDLYRIKDINITGQLQTDSACKIPGSAFFAEEGSPLSTATDGGKQWSYGNGNTGGNGNSQVCPGKVKAMSITCETSGATTGKVQIMVNGSAQGTSCQVSSPGSNNGSDADTTCDISFNANDEVGPISTTSDATTNGCIVTWWVLYD